MNHAHAKATQLAEALAKIAAMQAEVLASSKWVGDAFADRSRAMHYGEAAPEQIHGRATAEEASELREEGVKIVPLIVPFVPQDEIN